MIEHIPILPVLIPLIGGFLLLFLKSFGIKLQQKVSFVLILMVVFISIKALYYTTLVPYSVYSLGNWEAPFGIVLVLDKFSILMVLLTSLLALGALWYSITQKIDTKGDHFHPLFQLQLFGIIGAFLTGDLFNLFVFFEILLLASYSLLLHGNGKKRTKAGLHYVIINLVGSTLFLFAVGTLYGILGTLNIADLALKISQLDPQNVSVVAAAGLLLLVVFGLKAAMFPLYLWLPNAYSKTSAPVAALFAIMTKVGIYAIIRVHGTLFGETAGDLAYYHTPWVLYIGLFTLLLATLGVMAAKEIRSLVAYLVLASVSVLLVAIGLNSSQALSGTVYYMLHSTFIAGGFFLLADILVTQRGGIDSIERKTAPFQRSVLTGGIFFVFALGAAGLPPLSGFFGKVMILSAAIDNPQMVLVFTMLIVSSILIVISLARAGSSIFYDIDREKEVIPYSLNGSAIGAILFLFLFSPLMVIFANPITEFLEILGGELITTSGYIEAVLNTTVEVIK